MNVLIHVYLQLSLLQSVENNYPIMLTIDQRSSEVTIEGIAEYAMSANQDVFDWLRKFAHKRHCEAEAEIVKEQVEWFMKVYIKQVQWFMKVYMFCFVFRDMKNNSNKYVSPIPSCYSNKCITIKKM